MGDIKTKYPTVLTIAGSDSGGCAGIQADIKSISACGGFAASVITATTAQNTMGVFDIHAIPIPHLEKQLEAVFTDITFDAVKIGMLHSCEVIATVKNALEKYKPKNIVLDPVMVASSHDKLITDEAIVCLNTLAPMVSLITPNLPEAEILTDIAINPDDFEEVVTYLGKKYKTAILLKGGHAKNDSLELMDILYDYSRDELSNIPHSKINTNNIHGTGCSLSSSIATYLALGFSLKDAVHKGCSYVHTSIKAGENKILGKGNGPINHFGL